MRTEIKVKADILTWAITRAGFDLHEFIDKLPNVQKWIEGEKNPTVKQLEDFSRKKNQKSGGDFYATTKKRLSIVFATHVNNAVKSGKLLYRDACKLTSLKGDTFQKFFTEHF